MRLSAKNINVSMDIGILFYNHKNGHFRLFSKGSPPKGPMVKLINALCGFGKESSMVEKEYRFLGWKYYYIFDGKKLLAVNQKSDWNSELYHYTIDITPTPSKAADVTTLENKTEEEKDIHGTKFTFVKIVNDDIAKTTHQGSTSYTDRERTKLKSYFEQARVVQEILSKHLQEKEETEINSKKEEKEREKKEADAYAETPEGMAKAAAAAKAEVTRFKVWKDNAETFRRFEQQYQDDVLLQNDAYSLLNEEKIKADDFGDSGHMETNKLSKCFEKVLLSKDSREVSEENLEYLKKCVTDLRWKMAPSPHTNNVIQITYKDVSKILNPQLNDSSDPDKIKAIKQGIAYSGENSVDNLTAKDKLKYEKKMLIIKAYSDADDLETLVEDKEEFKKWDAIYDMIARKLEFLLLESGLSPPTYEGTTLSYKNFKKFLYDLLSDTHFIIQ